METLTTPDELELREHLSRASYDSEVDRKWTEARFSAWPYVLIAVFARPIEGAPDRYWLRFDCRNYPVDMPTAQPWDVSTDQPLPASLWPGGNVVVTGVFRPTDWRADALYLPCDRIAATTHEPSWAASGPAHLRWTSESDITQYLNEVHTILNSPGYTGARGS